MNSKECKLPLTSIAIVSAALFSGLLSTSDTLAQVKGNCFDIVDSIRVKINGMPYKIPAMYEPNLNFSYSKDTNPPVAKLYSCRDGATSVKGYRQAADAEPYNVHSISVLSHRPRTDLPASKLSNRAQKIIYAIKADSPQKFYCEHYKSIQKKAGRWAPTLHNKEFVSGVQSVPVDAEYQETYYYSDAVKMFGLPVMVQCNHRIAKGGDGLFDGNWCHLTVPVNKRNALSIRFLDGIFSPDQWSEGFKQIEQWVREMSLVPIEDIPFTSCNSETVKGE